MATAKKYFRFIYASMAFIAILFLFACTEKNELQEGVVATVNGRPITIQELNFARDSLHFDLTEHYQAVEELRQEYGDILSEMILQEIVVQYLERKKMPVTSEELAAEEASIRADFAPGDFEHMILEEGIDLQIWREMLKRRLAMVKVLNKQVRPSIGITADETQAYRAANSEKFRLTERLHFITINAPSQELVKEAAAKYLQTLDPVAAQKTSPGVQIREVRMGKERLEADIVKKLNALTPLKNSPVFKQGDSFSTLILLSVDPRRDMTDLEAFPIIEQLLLEDKLEVALNQLIAGELSRNTIKVSVHLLPEAAKKNKRQAGSENPAIHPESSSTTP